MFHSFNPHVGDDTSYRLIIYYNNFERTTSPEKIILYDIYKLYENILYTIYIIVWFYVGIKLNNLHNVIVKYILLLY